MTSPRRVALLMIAAHIAATSIASAQSAPRPTSGRGTTPAAADDDDDDEDEPAAPHGARPASGTPASGAPSAAPSTATSTSSPASNTQPAATVDNRPGLTGSIYDFPEGTETDAQAEARREASLPRFTSLDGAIGLLHMATTEAGADQTFRFGFTGEYFSQGTWLRPQGNADYPLSNGGDNTRHTGATLGLSYSPERHFDIHVAMRAYANGMDTSSPHLFQVLGDTTIGVKALYPIVRGWNVGIDASAILMNRTGDIGVLFNSTSANFRLMSTLDIEQFAPSVPIRIHLNVGYYLDNSSNLVTDVVNARQAAYPGYDPMTCNGTHNTDPTSPINMNLACQQTITREERFALGINWADRFNIAVGADLRLPYFRPFVEWDVGVPVVRNGYVCFNQNTMNPFAGDDDRCLAGGNGPAAVATHRAVDSFAASPSVFTVGTRILPPVRGLSGLLALDIATGGMNLFVRELAPTMPWTLYFGLGFSHDFTPQTRRVDVAHEVVREVRVDNTPIHGHLAGLVSDAETHQPIGGAVIDLVGHGDLGYVASGPQGRYRTHNIPPGEYEVHVRAIDYNEGTCRGTIPAPQGDAREVPEVTVDCALRAVPRVGIIGGRVTNSQGGAGVAGATVTLTSTGSAPTPPQTAVTGPDGTYRFENLPVGGYTVSAGASATTRASTPRPVDVAPRQTANGDISVAPVDTHGITVTRGGITVRDQIHFQTDSTEILPDSNTLVERIADVMNRHPELSAIEIQGHTDNQGPLPHNMQLSQGRAESVRAALVSLGVASDRLTAHGYGPTRPIAPNLTAGGRARNRRVMFIVTHSAAAPGPGAALHVAPTAHPAGHVAP